MGPTFCQFVLSKHVTRAIHNDKQPHEWAISWNTSRTFPDPSHGGNFFFAEYGIRVQNAPNTLIAWKPQKRHGTSLQKVNPNTPPTDFQQIGLAIVTSNRLPAAWRLYQRNKMTEEQVTQYLQEGDDKDADISFGRVTRLQSKRKVRD
jgi:hypothetical protein